MATGTTGATANTTGQHDASDPTEQWFSSGRADGTLCRTGGRSRHPAEHDSCWNTTTGQHSCQSIPQLYWIQMLQFFTDGTIII